MYTRAVSATEARGDSLARIEQDGLPRQVSAKLRKVQNPFRNVANWRFCLGDSPRVHELQLQHVRSTSTKTIYFNGKEVHRSNRHTRDWVWTAQLYQFAHPVKLVIDYSTYERRGEDTVGYDLYIDGIPFSRMRKYVPPPEQAAQQVHRVPHGQQRWGAGAGSGSSAAVPAGSRSAAPAPAAPAQLPTQAAAQSVVQTAPAPAPDLLSFDAGEDTHSTGAAESGATSFDPLGASTTLESVTDDLAGLSWSGMGSAAPRVVPEGPVDEGAGGGQSGGCDLPDDDAVGGEMAQTVTDRTTCHCCRWCRSL